MSSASHGGVPKHLDHHPRGKPLIPREPVLTCGDVADTGEVIAPVRQPLDRARLLAFLGSGGIWITGAAFGLATGLVLSLIAAGYVLVGSIALAITRGRTGGMLAFLWGCAVALMAAVLIPVGGYLAVPAGLILGTVCFGLWAGAGFLLLLAFTGSRLPARS